MRLLTDLLDLDRLVNLGVDPDATAVSDGQQSLTWRQYAERVARLAGAIRSCGVEPGDRVGVRLPKSCDSFAAVHAALRAGSIMVPIDPLGPIDQAAAVVGDAGIRVLVTDVRTAGRSGELPGVDTVICPGSVGAPADATIPLLDEAAIDAAVPADPPVGVDPDDPAYVIYTSGSTGAPKGIVHTHASALAYATTAADVYGLGPDDRMANIAPLHFDQSTFELYAAPSAGARVLVVPDPVLRFPASVAELIADDRTTVWYSVPFLLEQLSVRGALAEQDLSALRLVLYGGEAFDPTRLADLMRQLPGVVFSNVYGPAEVNQCTIHDLHEPPPTDRAVPIGRAWPSAELRLVDPDDHRRVVDEGPAMLVVATPTMMAGYWNRPDLTDAAIDVAPDGTRWYATGDLVRTDERGDLVFVGRADHQVKVRGHRIELEAVDAALLGVEGIIEAVTVVDRRPDGDDRLAAVVVLDAGHAARSAAELAKQVGGAMRSRLPRYAIPGDVTAVAALPRTPNGKLDRAAAAQLLSEGS